MPRAGGVLSALGLAISDLRRDYVAPLLGGAGRASTVDAVRGASSAALEEQALEDADLPRAAPTCATAASPSS